LAALLSTDPVCFRRTPSGDLLFPLQLAYGLEAVAIGCRTRLLLCRGEWFLDLDKGIPYLPTADGSVPEKDAILGQPFDPVKVRAAMLAELLSVPGVLDVPTLRISFDAPNRVMGVTWVARARFGDTPIDSLSRSI
jgi:hypothetical protein